MVRYLLVGALKQFTRRFINDRVTCVIWHLLVVDSWTHLMKVFATYEPNFGNQLPNVLLFVTKVVWMLQI